MRERRRVTMQGSSDSSVGGNLAALSDGGSLDFYRRHGKRVFDVIASCLLLALFAPLMGIAWLAVRGSSPGAAIFRQERLGRGGRLFAMFKFRSMVVDQDALVDTAKIEKDKQRGILFKPREDPRVTSVGRLLRGLSIDELPQLFNVLRGEMSLVGPRPLVPYMLAPFPDLAQERGRVRPGITGLWQVSARGQNDSARAMEEPDLRYVREYGAWMDAKILLVTPFKIREGAH